ncbi:zinc finger protein Pegasus [Eurytemora carolleeae]|uniref:zinc finger protein Pegasus n=1 Tax=Eurytemora carolleeae TaxID=1294199 RepID=UPI000C7946F7|nr:zinc finger protein Pegasus [Eurytemora carolleeae]|eukprot:XP_023346763.1 zinc finger protein Pegasus-like [Eurytemora affinis]
MRGEPHQHEDLDESSRGYEERRHGCSESYLFRKSPLTIRTNTPPARSDSPSSPPPTSSNLTPLLTATLNAPIAYQNTIRVKSDIPPHITKSSKPDDNKCKPDGSNSLSSSQSTFYSSLIHQLRQKTGENGVKHLTPAQNIKVKKEKTKPLAFMCPACKKRFQRQIAMNAHFQNEHISPSSGPGERTCKLCGGVSPSLAAVRQHLKIVHKIDLENPTQCFEETRNQVGAKYSVLEASLRSGYQDESEPSCSNIDMYESGQSSPQSISPSPAHTPTSSESPERSLFPLKPEGFFHLEEDDPQVEDLSIRKPVLTSPLPSKRFSPGPRSPRPESPSAKPSKKIKLRDGSPSPAFSQPASVPVSSGSGFTCNHCNIVYPNQTLYFLHRGFHSESNPWRCNSCGHISSDLYDFNTHLFSVAHQ